MATSPEFNEAQLAAARAPMWHQAGEPLLTAEAAREWIEPLGLVLFAPQRLAMTAPSLVEATLSAKTEAPSAADAQIARDLVARLTSEGTVLPLNLLGGGGDTPDFVVSVAAFKYIFTLRGDKSWKQAPSTSGSVKVTPLALRVFEILTERGALSAAELANELGREVTETAVIRSLNELWQMLRVIPLLAQGSGTTLWELTTRRFTKAIKAGVNAGQPTALSALVSSYFAQVLAATEDEIETFLSPLAARSRVREVLHALTSARELETVVLSGKTLLHISGALPEFPEVAKPEPTEEELAARIAMPPVRFSETETPEPGRIRTFASAEPTSNPVRKPAGAFARKPREERERRPFTRREDAGAGKKDFAKPWDEEKRPRREGGDDRPKRAFGGDRERKPFVKREGGGSFDRPKRPYTPRSEGEDRPRRTFGGDRAAGAADRPKRPFVRRDDAGAGKSFGGPKRAFGGDRERKPFVKREGGSFDRPKRPYTPRGEGDDRPKRAFGGDRAPGAFDRPKRPYTPRAAGEDRPKRAFGGDRERKPFVKREGGSFDRPKRPYTPRGEGESRTARSFGGDRERKPFVRREAGEGSSNRPARKPFGAKPAFGARKPFGAGKSAGKFGDKPRKPFVKREDGEGGADHAPRKTFGAKPAFGARKPAGGGFKAKSDRKPAGKKPYGAGKLFDKKGPLPADGEGGLSPTGSKRKRRTEE